MIEIAIVIVVILLLIVLIVKFFQKKPIKKGINKEENEIYTQELEFPEWVLTIWDWADLNDLSYHDIPRSESLLVNLSVLDLSYKNLTNVPKEISNIKSIKSLDLSNNQLKTIPDEIYEMQSLTSLYLSNNQIQIIPLKYMKLPNLEVFDTSNNPVHKSSPKDENTNKKLSVSINNIIKSIDSLAPLSRAIIEVQKLFSEGQVDLDISSFIKAIESDSLLSFNILKMANSPVYGFSAKISSISQAVTLFGSMQIYGFAIKYASSTNIIAKTSVYVCSNERFNDLCNIQSAILFQWYSKVDAEDAKVLAPLALVMETGKLVIAGEVSATSSEKEFKQGYRKAEDISSYEKQVLGVTSYDVNSMVFDHWHLDPFYIEILKGLSSDEELVQDIVKYVKILKVIITAVNIKSILSEESVSNACILVEEMGLNPGSFQKVAEKIKADYLSELKIRQSRTT